jgi:hypothetical protein
MSPTPKTASAREKVILAGLFLSKYDSAGLQKLGFENFTEAFNVIGYALGARPASIKNYRDYDIEALAALIRSFARIEAKRPGQFDSEAESDDDSSFAKRLITGLAAERYFQAVQPMIPEFAQWTLEDTTRLGCGYDFRLRHESEKDYLAVEVKGLRELAGSLSLTEKEHEAACALSGRFFLFVVKNFRETPVHEIYPNPLASSLRFKKRERVVVHVSWLANV